MIEKMVAIKTSIAPDRHRGIDSKIAFSFWFPLSNKLSRGPLASMCSVLRYLGDGYTSVPGG